MKSSLRYAPLRYAIAGLAGLTLLSGCGSSNGEENGEGDPAMTGALEDQIMVDPDLAGQEGGAATAGGAGAGLPPEQRSAEAVAAAKAEAAKMAGGSIQPAPEPASGDLASLTGRAATAAQIAQATRTDQADCATRVQYSMGWADRLPEALRVYPEGAVQEAAGVDADGCSVKVASFLSAVAPRDIIDFYYTRTRSAGYDSQYRLDGGDHVLGGGKDRQAYMVYARKLDNGLTEVDLVSTGK